MTIGSHFSVQIVKEIWWWHNSERNARKLRCKAKTTGLIYNWQKVPRWHGQEVSGQEMESH